MKRLKNSLRCKCGALVVFNEAELETLHEAPVCEWFKQQVADTGGREQGFREAVGNAAVLRIGRLRRPS